jgi:hypothetical protein
VSRSTATETRLGRRDSIQKRPCGSNQSFRQKRAGRKPDHHPSRSPISANAIPVSGGSASLVTRQGESDAMTLKAETAAASEALRDEIAGTLSTVTKLGGNVELVGAGTLPNDGKVIADERCDIPQVVLPDDSGVARHFVNIAAKIGFVLSR